MPLSPLTVPLSPLTVPLSPLTVPLSPLTVPPTPPTAPPSPPTVFVRVLPTPPTVLVSVLPSAPTVPCRVSPTPSTSPPTSVSPRPSVSIRRSSVSAVVSVRFVATPVTPFSVFWTGAPGTGGSSAVAIWTARPCSRAMRGLWNSSGASLVCTCFGCRSVLSAATASRESGRTEPSALPDTTTLCSSARRTVGCAGSRCAVTSSAPWKRWTRVVVVGVATPALTGSTSTTKTVPRTAAVAFGERISITSPGRMRPLTTATPIFPDARFTVTRPASSVTVRTDSSRTVMRALPPRRTRTSECCCV